MEHAFTLSLGSEISTDGRPRAARIAGFLRGAAGWVRLALAVRRERRALARMLAREDALFLLDSGIALAEARAEAARPFWDLPSGR